MAAAEARPDNADLHAVLGVLHNLSRDYPQAVAAFERALQLRPTDYSLWNKLGATQANATACDAAVPCYIRALERKPQYVRALSNARDLVRQHEQPGRGGELLPQGALAQPGGAPHRRPRLNMTFTAMNRPDLVAKAMEPRPRAVRRSARAPFAARDSSPPIRRRAEHDQRDAARR